MVPKIATKNKNAHNHIACFDVNDTPKNSPPFGNANILSELMAHKRHTITNKHGTAINILFSMIFYFGCS